VSRATGSLRSLYSPTSPCRSFALRAFSSRSPSSSFSYCPSREEQTPSPAPSRKLSTATRSTSSRHATTDTRYASRASTPPERGQAFGTKSKDYLATLVAGKGVEVEWHKRDRYKRIVGKVIRNGEDVNLQMVRAGLAWWYRTYAAEQSPADQARYEAAEDTARKERTGLWHDPTPKPYRFCPLVGSFPSPSRRSGSATPSTGLAKCPRHFSHLGTGGSGSTAFHPPGHRHNSSSPLPTQRRGG